MGKLFGFVKRRLLSLSVGAGALGAVVLALRFAKTPGQKLNLPRSISPAIFATRVFYSSRGQIVYHESGQGAPLIFLHGVYLGASSYEWSRVYPHFADRFQVLALDLLGFGESERSARVLSVDDHVRSLFEFCRAKIGEARAVIVASGLGATLAVMLADQHPELVQRLFLAMPVWNKDILRRYLPQRLRWMANLAARNGRLYQRYFASQTQIRNWVVSFGFGDPERIDPEVVEIFANRAQQFGAQRAVLHWLRQKRALPLEELLRNLTQPVTFLWGEKAAYPSVEEGHRLQSLPKRAGFVLLERCGVLAALEEPSQMLQVLELELNPGLRLFTAS
jgi:pimeloyl-ACP methyl ester carboxylesterase